MSQTIIQEKNILRAQIKTQRDLLNPQEFDLSLLINHINKLIHTHRITHILCYSPLKGEPDLNPLYTQYLNSSTVSLFFPYLKSCMQMLYYQIQTLSDLDSIKPSFIKAPKEELRTSCNLYNDHSRSLILVPAFAFDLYKNRLGFGKGFFDRFLPSFKGLKVGVCFDQFIFKKVPTQAHDIKMDYIVTEKSLYL